MCIIYFNNLAISFSIKPLEKLSGKNNIEVHNIDDVKEVYNTLIVGDHKNDINLYGYDYSSIFKDFCSMYKCIDAAGGIVMNNSSEYLLIKRSGIWDLPKGKVEAGEKIQEAAVREVCEETGLAYIDVTKSLPDTYHIYYHKKHWILKKTYWFLMRTSEDIELIPQIEEDISEAVWMKKPNALLALSMSYRSLYDNLGYLFR